MKYYTDGWMKGSKNPSPYGGGWTIMKEDGELIRFIDIKKPNFTNNEAEVKGIIEALNIAEKNDCISTDSMCCLTWINSGKSKARPDLNEILKEGKRILKEKNINLMWEAREFNLAGHYNEEMHKTRIKDA